MPASAIRNIAATAGLNRAAPGAEVDDPGFARTARMSPSRSGRPASDNCTPARSRLVPAIAVPNFEDGHPAEYELDAPSTRRRMHRTEGADDSSVPRPPKLSCRGGPYLLQGVCGVAEEVPLFAIEADERSALAVSVRHGVRIPVTRRPSPKGCRGFGGLSVRGSVARRTSSGRRCGWLCITCRFQKSSGQSGPCELDAHPSKFGVIQDSLSRTAPAAAAVAVSVSCCVRSLVRWTEIHSCSWAEEVRRLFGRQQADPLSMSSIPPLEGSATPGSSAAARSMDPIATLMLLQPRQRRDLVVD